MAEAHPHFTPKYHEPHRNDLCCCGSGLKFKRCCKDRYSRDSDKSFSSAYNIGDYETALVHARGHFTWYVLSHRAHTIPLLQINPKAGRRLLVIDIEALAELLEDLHRVYYKLGKSDEYVEVVSRVADSINDERWAAKIIYARALWCLTDKNDERSAFEVITEVEIEKSHDPDVLALYLQVCPFELTLSKWLEYIDRILSYSKKESVLLQYRVVKALRYILACQREDGERLLREAIDKFDGLPQNRKSVYGRLQLAYALELCGKITRVPEFLSRGKSAVKLLIEEANENGYTGGYQADLYRLLGDCEEGLGNHRDAVAAYLESLQQFPTELTKVFLSRSWISCGDLVKASETLNDIREEGLSKPGLFDLAISWAVVAAASLNHKDIENAKARLKVIETRDPAFIQLRDNWLIEMLETTPKKQPGSFRKIVSMFNKYITLNPNIMGIGVNFNQIIDDVDKQQGLGKGGE